MSATDSDLRACIDRMRKLQRPLDEVLVQARQVRRSFETALTKFVVPDESLIIIGARLLLASGDAESLPEQGAA